MGRFQCRHERHATKLPRRQFLQRFFSRGIAPSEKGSAEKVVPERAEGERKHPAGIRWLLRLFVIVVVLGSLFNVFFGVVAGGTTAVSFLENYNLRRPEDALVFAISVLALILARFGFSFASKATTAPFDLLWPAPSTAPPYAGGLLLQGFLLIILEALLIWLWNVPVNPRSNPFCPTGVRRARRQRSGACLHLQPGERSRGDAGQNPDRRRSAAHRGQYRFSKHITDLFKRRSQHPLGWICFCI